MNRVGQYEVTPRDQEVLDLLVNEGLTNKEIGERLKISTTTVKSHIYRLKIRLGLAKSDNRVTLVRAARPASDVVPLPANIQLTPREWEVVGLVSQGLRNREAAECIGTTEQTFKNYLRTIYDKVGVWSRLELANWRAAHCGVIPAKTVESPENLAIPASQSDVQESTQC